MSTLSNTVGGIFGIKVYACYCLEVFGDDLSIIIERHPANNNIRIRIYYGFGRNLN